MCNGVSGSGKSTLILHTLYRALNLMINKQISRKMPKPFKNIKGFEYLDKIIDIDQSPIGRTPRSNPATYSGVLLLSEIGLQISQGQKAGVIKPVGSPLMLKAEDVKRAKVMV